MAQRIDTAKLYRQARRGLPETLDGTHPLPATCPVTLADALRRGGVSGDGGNLDHTRGETGSPRGGATGAKQATTTGEVSDDQQRQDPLAMSGAH
jgi:hypothetical protein